MELLTDLIVRAQAGDLEAFGRLVRATQTMALRRRARRASRCEHGRGCGAGGVPAGVSSPPRSGGAGGVHRLVAPHRHHRRPEHATGAALHAAAARRHPGGAGARRGGDELVGVAAAPARRRLADAHQSRSAGVRPPLPRALEHGPIGASPGVDEPAMRKRLQRIRDKLRKEMEVSEQHGIRSRRRSGRTFPPRSSSCSPGRS